MRFLGGLLARSAALALVLVVGGSARAGVPAVELSTDLSPSVARDIDEWSRVYVEGRDFAPLGDGRPLGQILVPPHPGGGEILLPCSGPFGDPMECFHEYDIPGGFAESGRIIGRHGWFGSGGPFIPAPATWSADGTLMTGLEDLDEFTAYEGHVAHGNSGDVFVGFVWGPTIFSDMVPVYWSGPAEVPIELANLGYFSTEKGPYPERINDTGEIVGSTEGSGERAAIWRPPGYALEFLGELAGGATSRAHDLDSSGLVVGSSDDGSGDVAVIWRPNGSGYDVIPLPVPPGFEGWSCTEATAISDDGRIAGNCTTASGRTRGVIWQAQGESWVVEWNLKPLPDDTESAVFGLNESGQAVGRSGDAATGRAVLWNFTVRPVPSLSAPALLLLALTVSWMGRRALRRPTRRMS
jgi:hypothetical protein